MLCSVLLHHVAQLVRLLLRFSQFGVLVAELSVQVLFGAGKGLHVKAQHFQGSFGGSHYIFFHLQKLSVALLLSGQSPLQLRHPILQ
jgi:hypothetical protein